MAEHVLRAKLQTAGLEHVVISAGTGSWHVGQAAHPSTQRVLAEAGYTNDHRAQQFTASWFDELDLIVVMDRSNLRNVQALAKTDTQRAKVKLLRSFDPTAANDAEVPDPYDGPYSGYLEVLAMVEAACDGLVATLN